MIEGRRIGPNRLRQIRKEQHISQAALAVRSGVSEPTQVKIELHDWIPSYAVQLRLAEALGVTITDIWPPADDELVAVPA